MVNVPEEMKEVFSKQRVIPMATADKNGKPNVILVGMWWWEDDETLCVVNNFLNKTFANIESNPQVAFNGWADGKSIQIKCTAENHTDGPFYMKGHEMAQNRERPLPGRSVVACKVSEVYQGNGGKGAGQKLL